MTVGVRFRDSSGNLRFDITTRTGQFFGSFQTNGNQSGSFVDSSIVGSGTFFAYTANQSSEYGGPVVNGNLSNGAVNWSYQLQVQDYTAPYPNDTVFYGVY